MPLHPTPWAVNTDGAIMPAQVLRNFAAKATQNESGVGKAHDFIVTQTPTPSNAVRILPGTFVAYSAFPGAFDESYIGWAGTSTDLTIPAAGAGAARIDLIAIQVTDPEYTGDDVSDPVNHQYIRFRIYQNVTATQVLTPNNAQAYINGRGDTGVALYSVKLAAGQSTIGAANLGDCRQIANPKRQRILRARGGLTTDSTQELSVNLNVASTNDGQQWPGEAGWYVDIPIWATQVQVVASWNQILVPKSIDTAGRVWVRFGSNSAAVTAMIQPTTFEIPGPVSTIQRTNFHCADTIAVPAALRGQLVFVHMRGGYTYSVPTGANRIKADAASSVSVDMEFLEHVTQDSDRG